MRSLSSGDTVAFVHATNAYFSAQKNIEDLIFSIRTSTYEIHKLNIPSGSIVYPSHARGDECLKLAILFEDRQAIQRFGLNAAEGLTSDPYAIVAASYQRDFTLFERNYNRLAASAGILPLSFAGETIADFFQHLADMPQRPAVETDSGKVSVIMTVFNPDLALAELALRSILRQTYQNFEVILVDDGSDRIDGQAIRALCDLDERIRCLQLKRNGGPYVGRNAALEIATGAFIAIQDADDYAHPQRLERQIAELRRSPILKLCTTAHVRVDTLARIQFEHTFDIYGDGPMTSLFRREVFDVIGGFATVRSRGDVEFRERLKACYGAHAQVHVDVPMMFCHATPGSLSNTTETTMPSFLALFRTAIDRRVRYPVIAGRRVVEGADPVEVPWPLRPEHLAHRSN